MLLLSVRISKTPSGDFKETQQRCLLTSSTKATERKNSRLIVCAEMTEHSDRLSLIKSFRDFNSDLNTIQRYCCPYFIISYAVSQKKRLNQRDFKKRLSTKRRKNRSRTCENPFFNSLNNIMMQGHMSRLRIRR